MRTKQASGTYRKTVRLTRLSHSIASAGAQAEFSLSDAALVIAFSLLRLASGESEIAEQRCEDEKGHHRDRDCGSFAQHAGRDAALEGERRHEVGRVDRTAASNCVDELEIGEGEDDREGHYNREDRQQQGEGDVAEALPACRAVDQGGFVQAWRDSLQPGEERDCDERYATPDIRSDQRPARRPGRAEKVEIGAADCKHIDENVRNDRELG